MPHKKRVCRRSSRPEGRPDRLNYSNDRVAAKALKREKAAKQARKRNRRKK